MSSNRQEWFNKTVIHLLKMKRRARGKAGHCTYMNDRGEQCPIGHHIPDDHPALTEEVGMELPALLKVWPALSLEVLPNEAEDRFVGEGFNLACSMQEIHDDFRSWGSEGFTNYAALLEVAETYSVALPKMFWKKFRESGFEGV